MTATFQKTGKKFSVEAKRRQPDKASLDVGNQLYDALKKNAKHTRLIFIEVNVPDDAGDRRTVEVLGGVLKSIRTREDKLTIKGQPAPPAYVIVTNTHIITVRIHHANAVHWLRDLRWLISNSAINIPTFVLP